MIRCGKCDSEVSNEATICRACGAIVRGPLAVTTVEAVDEGGSILPPRALDRPWRCPSCGEQIDASFDACWSCGTSSDGELDPSFVREGDLEEELPGAAWEGIPTLPSSADIPNEPRTPVCLRCGSRKIVENVCFATEAGAMLPMLGGHPVREAGELQADVCIDCGRMEWRLTNVAALWDQLSPPSS